MMRASTSAVERHVPRGYCMPEEHQLLLAEAKRKPAAFWMLKKNLAHGGNGNKLLRSLDDVVLEKMKGHVVQVRARGCSSIPLCRRMTVTKRNSVLAGEGLVGALESLRVW